MNASRPTTKRVAVSLSTCLIVFAALCGFAPQPTAFAQRLHRVATATRHAKTGLVHVAPAALASVVQTPAPASSSKEANVFGMKIHYVEAGSGPVVVLLHGLGGNTMNWAFNVGTLAQKYRVVVPDQIGFGRSDKPLINYRITTYVDFLDKFLSELKIEKASLVGNSMGGWIAAAYALAHPSKVERLVLADAAGFAPPKDFDLKSLSGLNPTTREGMRQLASLVFYNKQLFTNDAAIDLMLTQRLAAGDGYTIQRLIESIARNEDMLDNRLAAIKQPTLIIWGRDDGLTPFAREGERFKKEMPAARFVVFEQCGHVPQVEKAAEFNAAVLQFLGGSSN
ncbi:MAG TPA: alpha/beta hydrolase [Pyrinomonadaceae bacterium]|jgi:pimeloyl-ACP methyl ester carboxylesterase